MSPTQGPRLTLEISSYTLLENFKSHDGNCTEPEKGVNWHYKPIGFILSIFGYATKVETSDGGIYLNQSSLDKWLIRHKNEIGDTTILEKKILNVFSAIFSQAFATPPSSQLTSSSISSSEEFLSIEEAPEKKVTFSDSIKVHQYDPNLPPTPLTYDTLKENSKNFAKKIAFPTENNLIEKFSDRADFIVECAENTRPIIHSKVEILITDFLAFKQKNGTDIEKKLYANMDTSQLIDRLLTKRPLMFMLASDQYLLRDGKTTGHGVSQNQDLFAAIGTDDEKSPLTLQDYISYDEMQLAALIGMSTPTLFINDGDRNNKSNLNDTSHEDHGVYIGLVGTRFERPGLMEWKHMMVTKEQNKKENGYGNKGVDDFSENPSLKMYEKLYGTTFPTFEEVEANPKDFVKIDDSTYLNLKVYKKRMRITMETFLLEANERGKKTGQKAYVHTVGLGIGVWAKNSTKQAEVIMDTILDIIQEKQLTHIADIDLSWFPKELEGHHYLSKETPIERKGIKIHLSKRNPAAELEGENKGKLLVASYAWDGNSFPGNEYWEKMLSASGDPAAACCSLIPELQNPEINPRVSGQNACTLG